MATIRLPDISLAQLPGSISRMRQTFDEGHLKRGFLLPMANRMLRETQDQFTKGKDPTNRLWKSSASSTKYNGRWSKNYNRRPSGLPLKRSDTRLRDTGKLRDSYKITKAKNRKVIVEPVGDKQQMIAGAALKNWGNHIIGWTPARLRRANKKLKDYMIKQARKRPL